MFHENGDRVDEYDSFQRDGAFVPTPEPGTIGLFGLGLATLAAKGEHTAIVGLLDRVNAAERHAVTRDNPA